MNLQDVAKFFRSEEWLYMEQCRLFNAKRMAEMAEACERFTWRPIETAPRDGSNVLLHEKWCDTPFVGYWNAIMSRWAADMDHIGSDGSAYSDICQLNITHWMPLPDAPDMSRKLD